MTFWQTLCQNVPLLLVLVPLFGAGLILATARGGAELARRTALSNACVTCALAAVMVARFDPELSPSKDRPAALQMTTSLRWIGGEAPRVPAVVRIVFGVDGINLWFAAAIPLVALAALAAMPSGFDNSDSSVASSGPAQYALLLASESLLLGTVTALDVLLFATFLASCPIPLLILCGMWGGPGRREAVRRFFAGHVLGGMLLLAGLLGLAAGAWDRQRGSARADEVVEPSFFLLRVVGTAAEHDAILSRGSAGARELPALLMGVGLCLLTPLAGRHSVWREMAQESPPSARILLLGGLLGAGVYCLVRCVLPVLGANHWAAPLPLLAAINALWISLQRPGPDGSSLARASLCHAATACAGALSFSPSGILGGLLLPIQTALCIALAFLPQSLRARRFASVALAGLPGLCVFPALWMVAAGVMSGTETLPGSVVAAALLVIGTLSAAWQIVSLRHPAIGDEAERPGRSSTRLLAVLLTALIIAGGLAPRLLTSRMVSSVERIR